MLGKSKQGPVEDTANEIDGVWGASRVMTSLAGESAGVIRGDWAEGMESRPGSSAEVVEVWEASLSISKAIVS